MKQTIFHRADNFTRASALECGASAPLSTALTGQSGADAPHSKAAPPRSHPPSHRTLLYNLIGELARESRKMWREMLKAEKGSHLRALRLGYSKGFMSAARRVKQSHDWLGHTNKQMLGKDYKDKYSK